MTYDLYGQVPVPGMFYVAAYGQEHGPYPVQALAGMANSGALRADTMIRDVNGGNYFPAGQMPGLFSTRDWTVALVLSIVLGTLGVVGRVAVQLGIARRRADRGDARRHHDGVGARPPL